MPTWNIVDERVVGHQVAALEPHATVVTYAPRGAGASERPRRGWDFPLHAADALASPAAAGIERAALVTASRGVNAAVLLTTDDPERFDRLAVVGPYMQLEPGAGASGPEWLEALRTDWPGSVGPFMHAVLTEPGSADLIEEMIGIGLEATPRKSPSRRSSTELATAGSSPRAIRRRPLLSLARLIVLLNRWR